MILMKEFTRFAALIFGIFVVSTFTDCSKNALGRSTLDLVDDGTMNTLAVKEYSDFLSAHQVITGTTDAEMVQRVGYSLSLAVKQYLTQAGQLSLIDGYNWEYKLVNSPEANAWCLPGGKIVVYTGILAVTQDEASLAVVMGHEISHAVLKHGNEQMSQQLVLQYGGVALSTLIGTKPAETQALFSTVYGIGSSLGSLAFSRKMEYEADEEGLYFMAMAKYNPNTAVSFWQRMQAQAGSSAPPEFLSTHPSDVNRIDKINEHMAKALTYYHP